MKFTRYFFWSIVVLLLVPLAVAELQKVIVFELELYKNDTANLLDYNLDEGVESLELSEDLRDYRIELKSLRNETLYIKYLQPPFDILIDPLPGQEPPFNGSVSLDKVTMTLKLNYVDGTKTLELYHKEKRILTVDIEFCNNNNVCEVGKKENYLSCPSDCPSGSKDNYCDRILDGKCDLDCGIKELDIDCTCGNNICDIRETATTCPKDCGKDESNLIPFIIGGVAILALISVLTYLKKKKHKPSK